MGLQLSFCIRNDHENLVFAEGNLIEISNNLIIETVVIRLGMEFCRKYNLFHLVIDTDSLDAINTIDGPWYIPWTVFMEFRRIQVLKEGLEEAIVQTERGKQAGRFCG